MFCHIHKLILVIGIVFLLLEIGVRPGVTVNQKTALNSLNKQPFVIQMNRDLLNNLESYKAGLLQRGKDFMTELTVDDTFTFSECHQMYYPNAVTSVNGITCIASCKSDSLIIVNATDPNNLDELSHITDGIYLNSAHDVDMTMDGNYVYVVSYTFPCYLTMYDITNKTSPSRVNQTLLNETGMYIDLDANDNFLYLTTKTYNYIFNVTNKADHQMNLVKKFNTEVTQQLWHPTVYGNTLYVGQFNAAHAGYGILAYNVTNKSNPVHVNTLCTNRTVVDEIIYNYNGFDYLIFTGDKMTSYHEGYITCMNISASNATHPTFMFQKHWIDAGGNSTTGNGIAGTNGYLFIQNSNWNHTRQWNNGILVFNWTNTAQPPEFLSKIYGKGPPNYLNDNHEIDVDKNGSHRIIYTVTKVDNSLVTLSPNWYSEGEAPKPSIAIEKIYGGNDISVVIKNIGNGKATNVSWSINLSGGLILKGKTNTGNIPQLNVGEEQTIQSPILGIGRVAITVTTGNIEKEATGLVFLSLVFGVK